MEWEADSVLLISPPGDSNAAGLMAGVWEPQISITGLTEAERMDRFAGERGGPRTTLRNAHGRKGGGARNGARRNPWKSSSRWYLRGLGQKEG